MKSNTFWKLNAIAAAVIAGSTMVPVAAISADEMVEEIVTVGARAKARSVTDSVAAVDVISASELTNQGDVDVTNLLRNSVPSYYVNDQPISDAGTMVRPQGLRGMAADHTLILVLCNPLVCRWYFRRCTGSRYSGNSRLGIEKH